MKIEKVKKSVVFPALKGERPADQIIKQAKELGSDEALVLTFDDFNEQTSVFNQLKRRSGHAHLNINKRGNSLIVSVRLTI